MSLVAESAGRLRVRVDTARLRDLVSEIGWAKVSNVRPEDYARLAEQHHRSVATIDPETVARIFTGYEEAKRDRGRIDFEDILLCTAALISDHPEVAEQVRRTYRHLVVDEYQDVSPLQEALLTLWRGDGQEICVVGDPAQTIHSFAGRPADVPDRLRPPVPRRDRGQAGPRLPLDPAGRRLRQRGDVGGRAPSSLTLVRAAAGRPAGRASPRRPTRRPRPPAVADWVEAQHAAGVDYRDLAVLYRINAQSPPLEQALAERRIPYLVRSGERFYERPEVRQTLVTLRTQLRAPARERGRLGAGPVQGAARRARLDRAAAGGRRRGPGALGVARRAAQRRRGPGRRARRPQGRPLTLAEVSAELDRRADAQHVPVAQGVTVSTLHSAKGLEWEARRAARRARGLAALRARDHAGGGRRGAAAALRRHDPRAERCCGSPGRAPATAAATRASRRGSSTRCCRPSLRRRPPGAAGSAARKGRGRGAVLSVHCRSCGKGLNDAAERKLGRHHDCPSTFDEVTLDLLREWRRQEAASASLPAYCVFTDATLVAIAEARPRSDLDLFKVQGLGKVKVDKYGEQVLVDPRRRRGTGARGLLSGPGESSSELAR